MKKQACAVKSAFLFAALFVALMMLFSACTKEKEAEAPDADPSGFNPETELDNRFAQLYSGLIETDDLYYWSPGSFLFYCEKDGSDFGVVCGRPECEHFSNGNVCENDPECSGYGCGGPSLRMYEGKLYYVTLDQTTRPYHYVLMKMEPDATGKTKVMDIYPPDEDANIQDYRLHRGFLYSFSFENLVQAADVTERVRILATPIGSRSDYSVIYSRENDGYLYSRLRFVKQYCYVFTKYSIESPENGEDWIYGLEITRWNCETGEAEQLYDGSDIGAEYGFGFNWVDLDGNVYVSVSEVGGCGRIYRLDGGCWTELFDMDDPAGGFWYSVRFGDGIVVGLRGKGFEKFPPPSECDILIKKLDGTTLYCGPLPMEWLENIDAAATFTSYNFITGDANALIAEFEVTWRNRTHTNEPTGTYLVRYDISPDGLVETLLGSIYAEITPKE